MIFLAFNILTSGVPLSMVCAVIGLAAAFYLIGVVVRSPAGNQRMQEIAGAVQEGAKAYLNRQVITISSIAVIIFILLFSVNFTLVLIIRKQKILFKKHWSLQKHRLISRQFKKR